MKKLLKGVQGSYVLTQFYKSLQNSVGEGVDLGLPKKKVIENFG